MTQARKARGCKPAFAQSLLNTHWKINLGYDPQLIWARACLQRSRDGGTQAQGAGCTWDERKILRSVNMLYKKFHFSKILSSVQGFISYCLLLFDQIPYKHVFTCLLVSWVLVCSGPNTVLKHVYPPKKKKKLSNMDILIHTYTSEHSTCPNKILLRPSSSKIDLASAISDPFWLNSSTNCDKHSWITTLLFSSVFWTPRENFYLFSWSHSATADDLPAPFTADGANCQQEPPWCEVVQQLGQFDHVGKQIL